MILAYEEFVEFIAAGATSKNVVDFRPSDATRNHVSDLLRRQKAGALSPDETAELNGYLVLEHVMRLAKARARQHLTDQQSPCL